MISIATLTFASLVFSGPLAPPARNPSSEILKREVDDLVRILRRHQDPSGAFGDGSCRATAMVLTALGHSHRFYHAGDGPWIAHALTSLFEQRASDGGFSSGGEDNAAMTTRWVIDALNAMDPESYASDVNSAHEYLKQHKADSGSPFAHQVATLRAQTRRRPDTQEAIAVHARKLLEHSPRGYPITADGSPDTAASAVLLTNLVVCQVVARGGTASVEADDNLSESDASEPAAWTATQEKGFQFLLGQQKDGVFFVTHEGQKYPDVGLTGIGLAALQTKPKSKRTEQEHGTIVLGLGWLADQQDDSGFFGQNHINYSTCAAVMALAAANDERYRDALDRAQHFLVALQNIDGRGYAESDRDYGSIGYGGDERGDLSNSQFALEALRNTHLDQQHEAFAKAIVFLQRTQNLREFNDYKGKAKDGEGKFYDVVPGNDGGAAYYPGNSPAGYIELPGGGKTPRSYGSMTYALLKAYTLCGLEPTDPRVQAAVGWIQAHWDLSTNPGVDPALGEKAVYQGLYYYYMVMAQALDLVEIDEIETVPGSGDTEPVTVDWRAKLREHLEKQQRDDGSWLNTENGRWWENLPMVCTVYALLALERCDH